MTTKETVPQFGAERATLWRGFLLDAGVSPDQHPVALFGKPVVDRIFVGTSIWHWRQLAWPALVALGTLLLLSAVYALRLPGGGLYAAFGGALAMLAFLAAHHLWNDHRRLPGDELHLLAADETQHRWLDRLERYQARLVSGEIAVFAAGSDAPLDGSPFAHNNGRILILDSCYDRTDRARLYRDKRGLYVLVPGANGDTDNALNRGASGGGIGAQPDAAREPPEHPLEHRSQHPEDDGARSRRHFLHGVSRADFELALYDYLAAKVWDKTRKDEFVAALSATFDLVQNDPFPHQGRLLANVRKRASEHYKTELSNTDESLRKKIGNARSRDNSDFRSFVIVRSIQAPLAEPPSSAPS